MRRGWKCYPCDFRSKKKDTGNKIPLQKWFYKFILLVAYIPVVLWHKFGILWCGIWLNTKLSKIGLKVSLSRLIWHDMSKFSCAELVPYALKFEDNNLEMTFIGRMLRPLAKWTKPGSEEPKEIWEEAWKHHYQNNDHHAEFWKKGNECIKMPSEAVIEMVADWHAATWSYDGYWPKPGHWKWIEGNFLRFEMHPCSRALLFSILCMLGYEKEIKGYSWHDAEYAITHHGSPQDHHYLQSLKSACPKN